MASAVGLGAGLTARGRLKWLKPAQGNSPRTRREPHVAAGGNDKASNAGIGELNQRGQSFQASPCCSVAEQGEGEGGEGGGAGADALGGYGGEAGGVQAGDVAGGGAVGSEGIG